MARDKEPITQTMPDYFEGWYDADAAPCREYLHPMRTGGGWKVADALWLPR